MIIRLASISLLALAVATLAVPASAADESAQARAASYYASGLEKSLLLLRTGTQLVASCTGRLRGACSREQRALAANDRTLTLLDALTLFPQRLADDPAAGIHGSAELRNKIAATSAELLAASAEYDAALFARYGATLHVCPDPDIDADSYRASIDGLIRIELSGFRALGEQEVTRAQEAIANSESSAVAVVRTMSAAECAATRKLGSYLMELMHSKLQPWNDEERRAADQDQTFTFGAPSKPVAVEAPRPELANAVAGNFASVVATELELTAHPENEAHIKAIADEVERAKQPQ